MKQNTAPHYENFDFEAFINNPEVIRFIGKNYQRYRRIWSKDFEKNKNPAQIASAFHWNWGAFLLAPAWFGYRKMFKVMAWFVGALCVFSALNIAFKWNLSSSIFSTSSVIFAFMGDGMYFDHVVRFFHKHKDTPENIKDDLIRQQGGTSTLYAILVLIAAVGAIVLTDFIASAIFEPLALKQ